MQELTRNPWIPLMLTLLLLSLLSGCGGKTKEFVSPEFPVMTTAQVVAVQACRGTSPVLDEWWVRYIRAWEKSAVE